jgi:chromosome segregation ATPase
MQERRQSLLRIIGSDADDMVRRARINHPSFSQDDRLRQDYNALKLLQERVTQEAKNKIDILTDRLNKSEFEVRRLRQQLIDTATLSKQLIEARATLQRREKEIITERQRFEEERQRFAIERQTLMTRLSALETGLPGGTNQSREAHSIKLAPWMGLIK